MTNLPYIEDPRVARVAKICCDEMLADIGELMAKGEDFFHARECVMADKGNHFANTYGKEVATRALQAMKATAPTDMPRQVIKAQDDFADSMYIQSCNYIDGGRHKWTPAQRWMKKNSILIGKTYEAAFCAIIGSPFVGYVVFIISWSVSTGWLALKLSAALGLATIIIMLVAEQIIGKTPKMVKGTEPKSQDDIMKQREKIEAIWDAQDMRALQRQANAEAERKQEQKRQREHAEWLRRHADDLEISAWQERGRLGTSLPGDPIHIPKATREPRTYRRRKAR